MRSRWWVFGCGLVGGISILAGGAAAADERAQPGAAMVVDGVAGANTLTAGYPTRGFGDFKDVDVWVPFNLSVPATGAVTSAVLVVEVRPIGADIGTDLLVLKGASGEHHVVYQGFHELPIDQFSRVEIDLTAFPDVLAAIEAGGTIEGVIEDDTAVKAVRLEISGGQ